MLIINRGAPVCSIITRRRGVPHRACWDVGTTLCAEEPYTHMRVNILGLHVNEGRCYSCDVILLMVIL